MLRISRTGFALLAMSLIILGAFVLRITGLEDLPFTNDEAWTLLIRESPVDKLMFQPIDPTGGLFYVLAKIAGAASSDPMVIRHLSLAFNLAMVAVGFELGRQAGGRGAGIMTAAVMAVMPLSVFAAQNGRAYSLVALAIAASALGLIRWVSKGGRGDAALYATGAVVSFYSHPTAVFWIAPSLCVFGWQAFVGREVGRRFTTLLTTAAMAVAAVPEALRLSRPEASTGFIWIVQPTAGEALWSSVRNLLPVMSTDDVKSLAVSACLAGLVLVLAFTGRRKRLSVGPLAVTLVLLSFPLWLWVFGWIVTPLFLPRALLPAAIGISILVGHGAVAGRSRPQAVFRGSAIVALYLVGHGRDRYNDRWNEMRDQLASVVQPGDAIMVCPFWSTPGLLAELHRRPLGIAAPVIQWRPHRITLIGDTANMDSNWARRWNYGIYRLDKSYAFDQGEMELRRSTTVVLKRVLLITRNCPNYEQASIRSWLGTKEELPPDPNYRIAAIVVEPVAREVTR